MNEPLHDILAVSIYSGEVELFMGQGKAIRNAEAIEKMAIMRRGLDEHFYAIVPSGTVVVGDRYAPEQRSAR